MRMQGCVCVCVCQDAHVWLFDRWRLHLFVHSGWWGFIKKGNTVSLGLSHTLTHTHRHAHTDLLSQGSPWAAQIGFGWLRSRRWQISQALHLFESLNPAHSPSCLSKHHAFSLLFSFFSPPPFFCFCGALSCFLLLLLIPLCWPSHSSNPYLFPILILFLSPFLCTHSLSTSSFSADEWSGKFSRSITKRSCCGISLLIHSEGC